MQPPYLSVVAAARNYDHGGNLLERLQTFVRALAGQARRHGVSLELVLVEWNPPPDRPPLAKAIQWPQSGPCRIRVVTVPAEIHRRYPHHENLPLFQMIAKNAGIRRAAGEFILATNIDILFSDEFFALLAARRLQPGRLYRMDRHDVDAHVPQAAPVPEQLQYCREHCIRLHAREGTFALTAEGHRRTSSGPDIVRPADALFFGAGWYPPEQHFGRVFRWASFQSEIAFRSAAEPRLVLLEVEPAAAPVVLRSGPFEARIADRSTLRLSIPPHQSGACLVASPPPRTALDPRTLCFRAFRARWAASPAAPAAPALEVAPAPPHPMAYTRAFLVAGARFGLELIRGRAPRFSLRRNAGSSSSPPPDLHLNASGDFTLLDRAGWFAIRGYPELAVYSMNLDSLFCYMAHYAGARECVLPEPTRIYHMEHGPGSGWTPEGHGILFRRLTAAGIPWMEFSEVFHRACEMERLHAPLPVNPDDWGLGCDDLPESALAAGA